MAAADPSVTVRCQLAASARRLPGADGLPIVERLLSRGLDRDDPYLPLMLWWAVEARALTDTERLLRFFGSREAWEDPGMRENALRLVRRYAAEGTAAGYEACARLLSTVTIEIPRRRPGRPRPRPGRAGRIAGRYGHGRAVRVGRDPGARNRAPHAPLRATHEAISRRHFGRLARRPGRRAPVAPRHPRRRGRCVIRRALGGCRPVDRSIAATCPARHSRRSGTAGKRPGRPRHP